MNKKQNSLMRFSRTERLAQLSEQEIVIERKKKEIQAKLEAQKKKQTEEAFRKLESPKEVKNNKPGFSKKSFWSKIEQQNYTNKEKPVELIKENLTNAFTNDGSFLDHFKKLSQTGLSANNTDVQTREKEESSTERDNEPVNDNNQSSQLKKALDSDVQFQIAPQVVQLVSQQSGLVMPATVDGAAIPSLSVPKFQGKNSYHTFHSNMQLHTPQSIYLSNSQPKAQDQYSVSLENCSPSSLASIQPPLPITTQNIPTPSPTQVHNIPPPPFSSKKLPKIRSESISMTLKINPVKKLEAIPNPLEVDRSPSPLSLKKGQISFSGAKESSKETFFSTKQIAENVFSYDRESSRVSSALFNYDQDGEEDGDLLDEKYRHWAELVAHNGDDFEEFLKNQNQHDPDIRFLLDKGSKEYLTFRKLILNYRLRLQYSVGEFSERKRTLECFQLCQGSSREINSSNTMKCFSTKPKDKDNGVGRECLESKIRQEIKTSSKSYENEEDALLQKKMSESTSSEENCFSSSRKEYLLKGESSESSKERNFEQYKTEERRKRKKKSRWGDAVPIISTSGAATMSLQSPGKFSAPKSTLLSQVTRSDPGLIQYARQTFGSTNLSEEDWKKAEDHYKINLLYQDMVKKRAEVEKLEKQGKFKYEYDSDEDTEGGTWEHKLRQQEMQATQLWAEELTRQAAGKHHIGDFLPPEELERFMEKYNAVKEGREPDLSDYKDYKLKEDNVGYRLLQKMGWNEGQGLGQDGTGITDPVNKATTRHENQGLGIERPDGLEPGDDEYDAYRKRMMLAYRFRPNPLNNPRRPYY